MAKSTKPVNTTVPTVEDVKDDIKTRTYSVTLPEDIYESLEEEAEEELRTPEGMIHYILREYYDNDMIDFFCDEVDEDEEEEEESDAIVKEADDDKCDDECDDDSDVHTVSVKTKQDLYKLIRALLEHSSSLKDEDSDSRESLDAYYAMLNSFPHSIKDKVYGTISTVIDRCNELVKEFDKEETDDDKDN